MVGLTLALLNSKKACLSLSMISINMPSSVILIGTWSEISGQLLQPRQTFFDAGIRNTSMMAPE